MSILKCPLNDTAPPIFVMQRRFAVLSIQRMCLTDLVEGFLEASFDVICLHNKAVAARYLCLEEVMARTSEHPVSVHVVKTQQVALITYILLVYGCSRAEQGPEGLDVGG